MKNEVTAKLEKYKSYKDSLEIRKKVMKLRNMYIKLNLNLFNLISIVKYNNL